jgi:hypothetical protein
MRARDLLTPCPTGHRPGRHRAGDRGAATAVGAVANVVVIGIAARNGTPISFWEFTKYGLVVTVSLTAPYLGLRYLM